MSGHSRLAVATFAAAAVSAAFGAGSARALHWVPGEPGCFPASVGLGSERLAYAAVVMRRAVAYEKPGGRVLRRFGRLNSNGVPMVFGVLGAVVNEGCHRTWYRVQLPMRPNGVVGFVRARDVVTAGVRTRIEVDLSAR